LLLGDLGYAAKSYADARERVPQDARPLVGEARVALARGRDAAADEKIAAAIDVDPESESAWTLKGMMYRNRAEHELARQALDRALADRPDFDQSPGCARRATTGFGRSAGRGCRY
jgi:Tfp pilus assembly protein PilF